MKLIEYFFYGIARCCFWILPGRALENGVPCAVRQVRHLAKKNDCKFYLTIRGICTIIAMR